MTTTSTLQYLDCATCATQTLHDFGRCRDCKTAFAAVVTIPTWNHFNNQTPVSAALIRKRKYDKARARGQKAFKSGGA